MNDDTPARASDPGRGQPRVLILDPDQRFARLLGSYLVANGWQAKHVDEPRMALARMEKLAPDLICIELVGPEPSGFDFVALLKRLPSAPPVVICTRFAAAAAWDPVTLQRLGVSGLVARPSKFPDMERLFRSCLPPRLAATLPPPSALSEEGA